MEGYHRSVLLRETIDALNVRDAWYIDCTLGDGGHSIEIILRGGNVVGIDVDPQALLRVQKRFDDLGIDKSKYRLIQGNFRDLKNLNLGQTETKFAGVLFDLGVSSLQLENPERGFSFSKVGPLDMRMDPSLQVRALDLTLGLNKGELYELFYKLGEEKFARALAEALVSARKVGQIKTTKDLAEIVEKVVRRKGKIPARFARRSVAGRHPATKVFQALRIAVNDELNALREGLDQIKDLIQNYGHILVTSFHSLEDRIVKDTFRAWEAQRLGSVVTKKPITPSPEEILDNPRARSAKLRVFEKL